jgi:hypothetical protein
MVNITPSHFTDTGLIEPYPMLLTDAKFEFTWEQFLEFRKMNPPEIKWNLPVTEVVKKASRRIT